MAGLFRVIDQYGKVSVVHARLGPRCCLPKPVYFLSKIDARLKKRMKLRKRNFAVA
jgi:hypothetical protein